MHNVVSLDIAITGAGLTDILTESFKIQEAEGDVLAEKKKWASLINDYEHYSSPEFEHWFFGKITREQLGYLVYKHTDHHLRQFNS